MSVIIAAFVGFLSGRLLWIALKQSFAKEAFIRTNYKGNKVPTAVGVIVSLSLLLVEGLQALVGSLWSSHAYVVTPARAGVVTAALGFAVVGLLDDLGGTTKVRGLRGHLSALSAGEFTSGMLKAVTGVLIAMIATAVVTPKVGIVSFIAGAGVIALSANLANLFDLRPGRSIKISLIAFVFLIALAKFNTALVPVAIVLGACGSLLLDDLKERLMLGDTGANVMGGVLGVGLVSQIGASGRVIAALTLLALTLVSEFVSFTKIFESVAPLRAFDELSIPSGKKFKRPSRPRASASRASDSQSYAGFEDDEEIDLRETRPTLSEIVSSSNTVSRTNLSDHGSAGDTDKIQEDMFDDDYFDLDGPDTLRSRYDVSKTHNNPRQ